VIRPASRGRSGIIRAVSENEEQREEREEFERREGEILREKQEHKGYGEDEGERDESFPGDSAPDQ
jgi:hypothetical protein